MKNRAYPTLVGSGLVFIASTFSAHAQTVNQPKASVVELDEVIVTARRKEESAQDVPQAISVVSGDSLDKLNFIQFEDLGKIVPGLSLSTAGSITTVRGVSFNPVAQTNPTVAMYINDAPLQSAFVFQSMFDIGQVELLRGPQGTLRGQSAPSGAITITTRKPDLSRFGGSMSTTVTDLDARNLQGAVNLPIIEDVFALRVAGLVDHTDNGGVTSVNSTAQPFSDSTAIRVSARFDPTSNLSVVAMYQNLQLKSATLGSAVYGNGAPGGTIAGGSSYASPYIQAVGVNGPVIPKGERLSVAENADTSNSRQQVLTGQVDYAFLGQKLSFVSAWSRNTSPPNITYGDTSNVVKGGDWPGRSSISSLTRRTNELRVGSEERVFGFLDYVVGVFDANEDIANLVNNGLTFQPGAFGSPLGSAIAQSPNLRYSTTSFADVPSHNDETSYFTNLTAHFWDKAELSAGVRYIDAQRTGDRTNTQTDGFSASRTLTAVQCAAIPGATFGTTYANVCDVPRPGNVAVLPNTWKKKNTVYSGSFSWHFTEDLMTYASYGTSWRPGPSQGSLINGRNDPTLAALSQLADETSKSIEVGLKSTWLDKRLRVNLDVYRQKFDGLVFSSFALTQYVADTGTGAPPTVAIQIPLNYNIDATVKGFDLDTSFAITNNWSVSAGYSYANGEYANQLIPCQDSNFDGIADSGFLFSPAQFPAGVYIAKCQSPGGASSSAPTWNATAQTAYRHAIGSGLEGSVSGLYTYAPRNKNSDPTYVVPGYGLLNLYVGIASPEAGWELQVFAKNALNKQTITSITTAQNTDTPNVSSTFGNSGYSNIAYTPRREYGVSFRYGFGSH